VVVQTDKGREMAWVVSASKAMVFSEPEETPHLNVIRKTTASDFGQWQKAKEQEPNAFKLAVPRQRNWGWL
jgi:cell fate regulator YaaT (PSP1 superfamily)